MTMEREAAAGLPARKIRPKAAGHYKKEPPESGSWQVQQGGVKESGQSHSEFRKVGMED